MIPLGYHGMDSNWVLNSIMLFFAMRYYEKQSKNQKRTQHIQFTMVQTRRHPVITLTVRPLAMK